MSGQGNEGALRSEMKYIVRVDKTERRKEKYTHVHKRAIVYAVGDDTGSRICLSGLLSCPCSSITLRGRRCSHAAR
jgi:hypothetical protein